MLTIRWSTKFRRDVKAAQKRGKDMRKFKQIHEILIEEKPLPPKNKDHILSSNWQGCRECHIEPDWLLIYRVLGNDGVLEFVRMGSHSDLFG
jgi:mRNA interferase YafQ